MEYIKEFFRERYSYSVGATPTEIRRDLVHLINSTDHMEGTCGRSSFELTCQEQHMFIKRALWTPARLTGEMSRIGNMTTISIDIWPDFTFLTHYSIGTALSLFFFMKSIVSLRETNGVGILAVIFIGLQFYAWWSSFQSKALIRATFEDALGVKPISPQT